MGDFLLVTLANDHTTVKMDTKASRYRKIPKPNAPLPYGDTSSRSGKQGRFAFDFIIVKADKTRQSNMAIISWIGVSL